MINEKATKLNNASSCLIDMTGWKMWEHGVPDSRLTVIERAEDYVAPKTGKTRARWLCECNCPKHNQIIVAGNTLRSGHTLSCGCYKREKQKMTKNKKYNIFNIDGVYGVGWTTNTNREFYFDLEDYDKIKDYCWWEVNNKTEELS